MHGGKLACGLLSQGRTLLQEVKMSRGMIKNSAMAILIFASGLFASPRNLFAGNLEDHILSGGPAPTPTCPPTSVEIIVNSAHPQPGGEFYAALEICNGSTGEAAYRLLLALEIYGQYFFYPSWSPYLDSQEYSVPPCSCVTFVLFDFVWPEEAAWFPPFCFYSALADLGLAKLYGDIDSVCLN
jgi:hypothetical protein